jgi:hypothetical protein
LEIEVGSCFPFYSKLEAFWFEVFKLLGLEEYGFVHDLNSVYKPVMVKLRLLHSWPG